MFAQHVLDAEVEMPPTMGTSCATLIAFHPTSGFVSTGVAPSGADEEKTLSPGPTTRDRLRRGLVELLQQSLRRHPAPRVDEDLAELFRLDRGQPDEHRRVAIVVRRREEHVGLGPKEHLLLALVDEHDDDAWLS